ncbi:hypothetical protein B0H10DRAFT_1948866 [Mycena sp. CBHHK59/15]|nr:hypothetical protein B0H10DRAFT_1948866 [Mycena sp. CBHHK59/15]
MGGLFSSTHEWDWDNRPYTLKYHNSHKELLATQNSGYRGTVRFTTYQSHLLHDNVLATIHLPYEIDEIEKMFLLMAVLYTETCRQDENESTRNTGIAGTIAGA